MLLTFTNSRSAFKGRYMRKVMHFDHSFFDRDFTTAFGAVERTIRFCYITSYDLSTISIVSIQHIPPHFAGVILGICAIHILSPQDFTLELQQEGATQRPVHIRCATRSIAMVA